MKMKFTIVGDSNVGKTTITQTFINNSKSNNTCMSTVGASFASKKIKVNEKDITINLWDTAGQEKYRSMIPTYYRGSHVIFLVFDISDRRSWESIDFWYEQICFNITKDESFPICVLIGNKSDRIHDVSKYEVEAKAKELNMSHYIISALGNTAVDDINTIFEWSSLKLLNREQNDKIEDVGIITGIDLKLNYLTTIPYKIRDTWCSI
jgi:small GTP-binding protein